MTVVRVLTVALPLAVLWGCSGGGGGTTTTSNPGWGKFRHDAGNSGQGGGFVEPTPETTPVLRWRTQVDEASPAAPISSSPAIGGDGTLYVGTERGTLAAINPTDGSIKWRLSQCEFAGTPGPSACVATRPLGPIISSPAVYDFNSVTNIFFGSNSGTLFLIQDNGTTRTCTLCFQPTSSDFGNATITASRFVSSPTFTASAVTGSITAIFIGASIDLQRGDTSRTVGKLYAVNTDGSVRWQFPRLGDPDIGPVTSSPALGLDAAVYFAADDILYALTANGQVRWTFRLPALTDAAALFTTSPLSASSIFNATAGNGTTAGAIFAANPDGSFRWRVASPDGSGFIASLTTGNPIQLTPTSTPSPIATPTPPAPGLTATPTPTSTPIGFAQAIYGITKAGTLVTVDIATGAMDTLMGSQVTIAGPVISSPALSADSFLVVAAGDGKLHIISTATGEEPGGWPLQLEPAGVPIRSSPSIGTDGTLYVGTDGGMLYAVGTQ